MTTKIHQLAKDIDEIWRDEQDAWNNRSTFFVTMHNREDRKQQVIDFLSFVKNRELLPSTGSSILDIGCGVCDYALGLARQGYQATGIDLSDGMIHGAKQLADQENLYLDLYIAPWSDQTRQDLNWNQTFDLTYSIFCPIMFDSDNILAMHKASKGKCLWVAFSARKDQTVDRLSEYFFGQDAFPWRDKVDSCLSTIQNIGKHVTIEYKVAPETEVLELDQAMDYFTMRLHNNGWGPREDMKNTIRELITPLAKEGKIYNKTEDTVAWVTWATK